MILTGLFNAPFTGLSRFDIPQALQGAFVIGPAGLDLTRRQGGQHVDVGQHQPRLVESADQVLAARGVDGGLAAHR